MVSLISDQGFYIFLYGNAKHNREGGRKGKTNKHELGSAPSKLMWHFLCILWDNVCVHSRKAPTKAASHAEFYWLDPSPSLDCSLKPSDLFCCPLSTNSLCLLWDPPSLVHFRSRGRYRALALCVCFAANLTKEFSNWHPHTSTQRNPTIVPYYR